MYGQNKDPVAVNGTPLLSSNTNFETFFDIEKQKMNIVITLEI